MASNILNFGSCFAGSVAHLLTKLYPGFLRVSSVQHIRVDTLLNIYKRQTIPPIRRSELSMEVKQAGEAVLNNQAEDVLLGRSLPYGLKSGQLQIPAAAIKSGVDLLLIDNFAELLFRLYRNNQASSVLYYHADHLANPENNGGFSEPIERLSPEEAIEEYIAFFEWVKLYRPGAKAIFLNFPVSAELRGNLVPRMNEFQKCSQRLAEIPGFGVIDHGQLSKEDYKDAYHFSESRYQQYAYAVYGLYQLLLNK